jgi:anti-sigma regulatory factor (Ser/Thr protein kinase)
VNDIHRLTLCNDRAEVTRLATWIDEVVTPLGLLPRTVHALHLCLEEAVTNVITHAFKPDTVHEVRVALWHDDTALHAEITDDGRPFDPLAHELPAAPADLDSAQIGGLGIKLMRSFAARIAYRRSGSMNRLTLSFPIN